MRLKPAPLRSFRRRSSRAITAALVASLVQVAVVGDAGSAPATDRAQQPSWTKNVAWVKHVPLEETLGGAFGATLVDRHLYVTGPQGLAIFDVSKASSPRLTARLDLPSQDFREAPATNGKVLVTRSGTPDGVGLGPPPGWADSLLVIDVRNKSEPRVLSATVGLGDHNYVCLLDCRWVYGAISRQIIDLRDPRRPKVLKRKWSDGLEFNETTGLGDTQGGAHTLSVVSDRLLLTGSVPMYLLDVSDPRRPQVVGRSDGSPYSYGFAEWPSSNKTPIAMSTAYGHLTGRCESRRAQSFASGFDVGFKTWDTTRWRETGLFRGVDTYVFENGTYADGDPAISGVVPAGWGCWSAHFDVHPSFGPGGLVALASSAHGLKLLEISARGHIREVGYFLTATANTATAAWIDERIVYAVDGHTGIDVLRFTGKIP